MSSSHRRKPENGPSAILTRIASEEQLWLAWDEVRGDRGAPGVDGVRVRDYANRVDQRLESLSETLRARLYRPVPLRRVWIRKEGKEDEFRGLAIPSVQDRIASRAAYQVVQHVFEPLFHPSSFGFRPGRGTMDAIARVSRLRDRGLNWVARADVDNFFDTIDQRRLFLALEAVLPWDVRRLLLLWTRTWIHDGDDRFRIRSGVPQGTATSPLLANFYVTSFDEALASEGFEAVRYADDLAVFAETQSAAHAALQVLDASLRRLGLALNQDGRQVRNFDEGFEFLGFEFRYRSVRIAEKKVLEFRRHALAVLEEDGVGSMRRRILLLNRMIRGWRAYYRVGVPRDQLKELDRWLESQVRSARLRRWAHDRPHPRELELAGLESLASSGRRVFQPPSPPSLQGYEYRIPLEGEERAEGVATVRSQEHLVDDGCLGRIETGDGELRHLPPRLRAIVIADGALCDSGALRRLLERGAALRFVSDMVSEPEHTQA